MNRRYLKLFRALIPSWSFFESVIEQQVLFIRIGTQDADWSEWRMALQRPPRAWYALLLNGEGNLHLACYSLLDQLEDDVGELEAADFDKFSQSASYQLTERLVRFLLRERNEWREGIRYQFKVGRRTAGGRGGVESLEEFLLSPIYRV